MNFATWEPVYETILDDFGFDRSADQRARDALGDMLRDHSTCGLSALDVRGASVAIAGAGDNLESEADVAAAADSVFAASTAADRLRDVGVTVDCMVTDLDKNPDSVRTLTAGGVPVAVHAHGDNIPAIREYVPTFTPEWVLPTTQARPVDPVENTGGFTDGDRGAFLADHLGASRLVFPGWDFDDDSVTQLKRQKLAWAKRLLAWLEQRRDERFAILDGQRGEISLP
jgi:uncharacterized Rossmann fold enzyme